ncbi:phage tail protein [Neisseriaceae bacterium B1]
MYQIFNQTGQHIGSCDIEPDADDLASRGEFAIEYDTPLSGSLKADPKTQTVMHIPAQPSALHQWDDEQQTWILPKEAQVKLFQAAQNTKLAELNTAAQNYIAKAAGTDKVPEFELQSWSLQALEAKAWAADKSAATPILDTIAANRKIPREALIQAALKKTLQYEALTAAVAGQRQALQVLIEKAQNMDALDQIAIQFTQPETA